MASRHMAEFTTHASPWYEPAWHHRLIASYLDRFVSGEIKRLMIFAPPRHGKSELISRHLPAFILGRNPNAQIIACSHAAGLASSLNRDVQRIMDSRGFQEVFPHVKLSGKNVRKDAQGSWLRNSDVFEPVGYRGSYRSSGVGGGIVGHGFDHGIIDDPFKDREEADSPVVRQNIFDWYASTFYTRRSPDAGICLMHQRWNEDDLAGRLLKLAQDEPRADRWTVLRLPAIAEEDGDGPLRTPRRAGDPLWPERFSLDDLARTRANSEYEWQALYQQNPQPEGGAEWDAKLFGPQIWFDEWPSGMTLRTVGLDPSKGKDSRHGDFAAFVLMGRTREGALYCEARMSRTHTAEQLAETACELQRTFSPDGFAVEANGFQELLLIPFKQAATKHALHLPLYAINNSVNKMVRIRRLGTYLAQGKIRFRANCPHTRELVRQLRQFPVCDHDDGPDAAEMALRLMIEIHNGRHKK